jgi:hypothetical protein
VQSLAEATGLGYETAAMLVNDYTPERGLGVDTGEISNAEDAILQMDASDYLETFTGHWGTPALADMQDMARGLTAVYQHDLNRDTVFAFAGITAHRGTPSGRLYVGDEQGDFTVLQTQENWLRNGNGDIELEESDIASATEIAQYLNGDRAVQSRFDKPEQKIGNSFRTKKDDEGEYVAHYALEEYDTVVGIFEVDHPGNEKQLQNNLSKNVPGLETDDALFSKDGLRVLEHKLLPYTESGKAKVRDGLAYIRILDEANQSMERNLFNDGLSQDEYIAVGAGDEEYSEFDIEIRSGERGPELLPQSI